MAIGLSSLTSFLNTKAKVPSPRGDVFLGIDIGASAIKIVQLKNQKGVPTLETYGELQLGPYEGVDIGRGTHLPPTKLVEALVDILREAEATGKKAYYAFSYSSSFTKIINVPTIDEDKIATILPVEARKYVPLSLTKVTLDWLALSTRESTNDTEVLLSAIYNESIKRYKEILSGAELIGVESEIELFSSIRSVVMPTDTTVAILDLGASSTRLYIVTKGLVRKTHSVPMSGVEMTRVLEKELEVDFAKAEEIKRTYGLVPDNADLRIRKVLTQTLTRGMREIHTVISRYEAEENIQVEKVALSGGASLLRGLDTFVTDIVSKPVVFADPFNKVAYPAFLEDTLKASGPMFAVAIGVALRAFQQVE